MGKVPCKQCPFRKGSDYAYDNDAHAALDDGDTPACHLHVGLDSIFAYGPMDPPAGTECAGHALWLIDTPGYSTPEHVNGR